MRAFSLLASALLLLAMPGPPALAQAKKSSPPPLRETIRYFQFSGDLLGELPIDGILKEVRLGAKIVSAVLDVCHSIPNAEPRKDRFVVSLKVEGDHMTGTGQSQEEKVPVTVNINRTHTGRTVNFAGVITRGETRTEVSSADNTDMSEDEFRENQPAEELIVATPADFTEVSPGSVAIRVKRPSLIGVVNELRNQGAAVDLDSLTTECTTLRAGEHVVRAEIDPERAAAIVARLKALPGVVNAGWTTGDYIIDNAVRLEAAAWRGRRRQAGQEQAYLLDRRFHRQVARCQGRCNRLGRRAGRAFAQARSTQSGRSATSSDRRPRVHRDHGSGAARLGCCLHGLAEIQRAGYGRSWSRAAPQIHVERRRPGGADRKRG